FARRYGRAERLLSEDALAAEARLAVTGRVAAVAGGGVAVVAFLARIEHAIAARRRRAGYAILARRAVGRRGARTGQGAAELRRRAGDEGGARATAAVRRGGARSAGARAARADGTADDRTRVGGIEERGRTAGDTGVVDRAVGRARAQDAWVARAAPEWL